MSYTLTAADVAILREIVHRHKSLVEMGRAKDPEEPMLQASDVYVAYVPADGIPALEGASTGTGTGEVIPNPGYADCDLYKVSEADNPPVLVPITGKSKRVYNVSPEAIGGDQWMVVIKDKFGIWFAPPVSGGTGTGGGCTNQIRYISKLCYTETLTGTGTG